MTKEICPICGENSLEHSIKNVPYTYKGETFYVNQPAKWCDSCGEGIISANDNKAVVAEIQAQKARIDGLLAPKEIQGIRKHLRLSQKEASFLFGGGVNAFNRYEKGINPIPRPLSLLLTLLNKHPEQLQELIPSHKKSKEGARNYMA
ncbi:type II toxin-antitoxin system MqsA family antitoxin [Legionella gresilensis]|uniref:type II toxin-antitoxin system MqsA family antitoxin n=1 Tax=Legionella gresilensis TaxID=91823 RepID=UPI00104185CD|nr:type II toxin-antitoxin system MqsA family antitoxin [Legionella gresilensis]